MSEMSISAGGGDGALAGLGGGALAVLGGGGAGGSWRVTEASS